jgi:transcription elongation factor GreA
MSEEKIELTAEGLAEIKAELKQLVSVERPLIVTQLKEARSQGDLSENADYSASKDALGNIDGKIADLEYRISNVAIISNAGSSIVKLGSQVEVEINGKKV